jgi:hypothetical protein
VIDLEDGVDPFKVRSRLRTKGQGPSDLLLRMRRAPIFRSKTESRSSTWMKGACTSLFRSKTWRAAS